ncbi:MAG: hypothetical protein FJW38_30250, partial [Acidobacteria bacterium]|nr:hypothetical protein [Acidobacteriota bacterium]
MSSSYFATISLFRAAISQRDFVKAGRLIRENLEQICVLVEDMNRQFGSFGISSIPVLELGGTILALNGDDEALAEMKRIVSSTPELTPWASHVDRHYQDRKLFEAILAVVAAHPNCRQTDLKHLVGAEDAYRIAYLVSYLDEAGKILRIREKNRHKLVIADSPDAPIALPMQSVRSHQVSEEPIKASGIDTLSIRFVPFDPVPPTIGQPRAFNAKANFEVRDAIWQIASSEDIPPVDRPDPSFRLIIPNGSGVFMVDDLGNADGLGKIESAALRYDRTGIISARMGFRHGVYRLGVHVLGRGMIAMSKDCIIHAYDDNL